ncbi:MAG: hypothetical protein RBT38_08805 [Bacteroidales bacterium]|jgi:hypothetical protein|nr:hypothetical protein [Bacteroidales bacterium]
MGRIDFTGIRNALIVLVLSMVSVMGNSQSALPEVLTSGSVKEQMDFIQEKTRIYEDYRAVREDMFQKLKRNAIDSIDAARIEIERLIASAQKQDNMMDSLNAAIASAKIDLANMTKNRNSIRFLGMEINKQVYNTIVWTIVAALAGLLAIGFLTFRRNRNITIHTKKEFEELRKEFEAYRTASREAREKMSMAHFNELKKLRGA